MTATPVAPSAEVAAEEPGLAKGVIKLPGVLFVAIATMAPGAGAAYAVSTGASFGGGALPLAVVFALVGSLLVAAAIGQLAKHISSAGGLGSYVGTSFHSAAGFVVAWAYPFMYLFAMPYLALVFGNLLAMTVAPDGGGDFNAVWTIAALACLAGAFATNYFGVEVGVRFGLILGLFEIVVLVVASVWMMIAAGDANSPSLFTTHFATVPGFEGLGGVVAASVYGFLAFIGFESAAPLAEETENPHCNVPRAVILSCLLIGVFYVLTSYASAVYFGPDKMADFMSYNGGNAWIGLAQTMWGGGWILLLVVLLVSAFACMNSAALAATRSMWAMGRSGTIPSTFGRVHPRWRSPSTAIWVFFAVGALLTVVGGYTWDPVTAYAVFGTVLTVCVLPIYFVTALACPVYFLRYRRSEFKVLLHLVVPVLGAILLIPAFFAGAGIPAFSFASALSYPLNLAGPIAGAWYMIGIGVAIYLLRRRRANLQLLAENAIPEEAG
ncbi:Amino acid transporter [Mycolicibacterium rutilum]|uniref:Amino acid transporter n=1 Tax=Mycolicibacterium rutilum TaxID=370526 RepID=A0A1H6KNF6_MYCRU|nr:APC family permease [Mycolicibacterium rutilum]SEH74376.1 Amino acid transporter [Mycolicibacterium rutilum]